MTTISLSRPQVAYGAKARAHADLDDSDIAEAFDAQLAATRKTWKLIEARDARLRDLCTHGRAILHAADEHHEREQLHACGVIDVAPDRITVATTEGTTRELRRVWPAQVCGHALTLVIDEQLEAQRVATGKRGHVMPVELMAGVMPLTAGVPRVLPALPRARHTI